MDFPLQGISLYRWFPLICDFPLLWDFPFQWISMCKGFSIIRDVTLQVISPLVFLCKWFPLITDFPLYETIHEWWISPYKGFPLARDFPVQGVPIHKGFPLTRDSPLKGFPCTRGFPSWRNTTNKLISLVCNLPCPALPCPALLCSALHCCTVVIMSLAQGRASACEANEHIKHWSIHVDICCGSGAFARIQGGNEHTHTHTTSSMEI